MSIASLLVFRTAEIIFNTRIALLSVGLWLTYIFNLWLIKQPNSEVPFIPLLYGAVYCVVRALQGKGIRFIVASGLLLGAAALVRPIVLLLSVLFATALLLDTILKLKKGICYAVVLVGVFCLSVLPWETEVYLKTGEIIPLSTNGPSSILDGLTFTRSVRKGAPLPWMPGQVTQLMDRTWEQHQHLKTTGQIFHYLSFEFRQHPKTVLEFAGIKLARSWFGTDARLHERTTGIIQFLLSRTGVGWTSPGSETL